MAIYYNDCLVGFLVFGIDPEDGEYWLIALLIDEKYQRRGYARAAVKELLQHLEEKHQCHKLMLGYRPENYAAESLYASLGFEEIDRSDTEVIRRLEIFDTMR